MSQPVTTNPFIIMLINMTVVFLVLIALGVVINLIHYVDPTKPKVKKEEVIFALVGNKSDLKDSRQVTLEEGQKFAEENNFIFQEISAKENEGFSDLFNNKIFEEIKSRFKPEGQQPKSDRNDIVLNNEEKKETTKKRRCC